MSIASRPVLPLMSFAAAILVILAICLISMMLQPGVRGDVQGQLISMPAGGLAVDTAAAKDTLALVLPNSGDHQVVER